ncbi:MAG: xanthine dehydrogenase accessory protein XdhC [Undibacterium sp.]|nr:xanthine dehydrogenase accessory protein XdhC [Undibacterium sp.]
MAIQTEPTILVTVAKVVGSAPRESGAKMLVTQDQCFDTIGGGHLEMRAIEIAREMLALPVDTLASQRHLERFSLGPGLGQCCGGAMHLAFERIDQHNQDYISCLNLRQQCGQDTWRVIALDQQFDATLYDASGNRLTGPDADAQAHVVSQIDGSHTCQIILDHTAQRWLLDPCLAHKPHLMLFGAGHVGTAIVRAMGELPCQITWIDEREDMFPSVLPSHVRTEATDTPEALIASAPPGVTFLVLTHSHALDQTLAEHILRRDDFTWFGLIGSQTKRMQFEHRLIERGINAQTLTRMVCPIGIPGIRGKEPAVIAASVAAQLLQVWEAARQNNPPISS